MHATVSLFRASSLKFFSMRFPVRLAIVSLLLSFQLTGTGLFAQKQDIRLEFKWSNDFFFQTDRYFSNGFDLALYSPEISKSWISHILFQPAYSTEISHAITITHHFFTPDNLFITSVDRKDRPFASYLLAGQRKSSISLFQSMVTESELQVGILGRTSGGKFVQNGIHSLLPASEPSLGWDNQLNPDLAINYRITIEKALIIGTFTDLSFLGEGRLGVPYTDVSMGLQAYAGKNISPYRIPDNKPGWGLRAQTLGRLVGYNATLQGGLFTSNIHELHTINRILANSLVAFVFTSRRFMLEAGAEWLSPEYPGGGLHRWGYVKFTYSL